MKINEAPLDRAIRGVVGVAIIATPVMGLDTSPPALSWNSSHASRGCSIEALRTTGGAGYFYCFAAN